MADEADAKAGARAPWPNWLLACVFGLVLGVVGIALYSGGALSKVSIPGLFDAEFTQKQAAAAVPVASREFILGQWQLQVTPGGGDVSSGTTVTYADDGTFTGTEVSFNNNQGERAPVAGTWRFQKISDQEFILNAVINGQPWSGHFKIFDANHIENEDQNYVAVRMP